MADSQTKASSEHSDNSAAFVYRGWVPTANGRLSFRHVGEASHPAYCKYSNVSGAGSKRWIVAYQRRDLNDFLFSFFVTRYQKQSGVFWFVLVCRKGPSEGDLDTLQGSILIFREQTAWKKIDKHRLRSRIDAMNAKRLEHTSPADVECIYTDITGDLEPQADIRCEFTLCRDGEVRVADPSFLDAVLQSRSDEYAAQRGIDFSKWAADQAYFFLRDMCHVHQHHAPRVDTILTLQDAGDDIVWRNHVLYSLHHYVIRTRRPGRNQSLHRARGVLAYARSFEQVCETRLGKKVLSNFNYEGIVTSLGAKIEENNCVELEQANARNWAIADSVGYRTLLVAIASLIAVVFVVLMQPFVDKNKEYLAKFGESVWRNAFLISVLFFGFIILSFFATDERILRNYFFSQNRLWGRDLYALSQRHALFVGWVSTLISTLVIAGVGVYAFWQH